MKSLKKLLWTLAGIAAVLLLVCVGIKLFDGRSPQAFFVHKVIGFRALDMKKYEADKADLSDRGGSRTPYEAGSPVSPRRWVLPQFREAALENAR